MIYMLNQVSAENSSIIKLWDNLGQFPAFMELEPAHYSMPSVVKTTQITSENGDHHLYYGEYVIGQIAGKGLLFTTKPDGTHIFCQTAENCSRSITIIKGLVTVEEMVYLDDDQYSYTLFKKEYNIEALVNKEKIGQGKWIYRDGSKVIEGPFLKGEIHGQAKEMRKIGDEMVEVQCIYDMGRIVEELVVNEPIKSEKQ
ncbi:hypothetical protein FGO68_gene1147 [Halteria grandinella]|uniref:Uncharacterized protein n=1 Tax=Halteria grandinella TaxID=5974 RepID=A0A8J8T342_HALGN|nr:hypothetical protein FGO68_gene1147 [Halteria grandinella]